MGQSFAQHSVQPISIHATLLDSLTYKRIAFASVYKKRDHKGTITDFKGEFILDNVRLNDTIVCSYIGFERKVFVVDRLAGYDTIYIQREAQLIDEMFALANDDFLYKFVSNARKTSSDASRTAKTYFELETFQNQKQLELFQGYYNGTFQGYDVLNLEMKNARFALAPMSKRIFASTETSKAMYMQKLMTWSAYFPSSPFEMKIKELRAAYKLSLASRYKDEGEKTVYVINFEPKANANENFQGTVWMDSTANTILKVKLRIANANIFPFQSIWTTHSLESVNMEITKSFTEKEGSMFLKSIDFDYDLTYKSTTDSNIHIYTRAVLYAYNYEEEFVLPYFDFTETSNEDYRRIQMLPYNTTFWECTDEFKMGNQSDERNRFLNELATIKTYDLFSSDTILKKNFFENPYITWSGNRVLFREEPNYDVTQGVNTSVQYHLEVQLFMDVNELCDSVQIITKTIFDPFKSYYKFPTTKEGKAFINIYFDLMEMERRKMAIELLACGNDIDRIKLKYSEAKQRAEEMSATYFREIEHGTNKGKLMKWNAVVLNALQIDNAALFGIKVE